MKHGIKLPLDVLVILVQDLGVTFDGVEHALLNRAAAGPRRTATDQPPDREEHQGAAFHDVYPPLWGNEIQIDPRSERSATCAYTQNTPQAECFRLAIPVGPVGAGGLEPPTSASQTQRATNCATPRSSDYYNGIRRSC